MVDKAFFKQAMEETLSGLVDEALWVKVNVEMAGQDLNVRQAKYIQMRADELASASVDEKMRRLKTKATSYFWHTGKRIIIVAVIGLVSWFLLVFPLIVFVQIHSSQSLVLTSGKKMAEWDAINSNGNLDSEHLQAYGDLSYSCEHLDYLSRQPFASILFSLDRDDRVATYCLRWTKNIPPK